MERAGSWRTTSGIAQRPGSWPRSTSPRSGPSSRCSTPPRSRNDDDPPQRHARRRPAPGRCLLGGAASTYSACGGSAIAWCSSSRWAISAARRRTFESSWTPSGCQRRSSIRTAARPWGSAARRCWRSPRGGPAPEPCGVLTDEEILQRISVRAFVDLDPAFTQLWHEAEGSTWDSTATTGSSRSGSAGIRRLRIPTCGRTWITTPPPIVLEHWPVADTVANEALTTVGHWRAYGSVDHRGIRYGQKAHSSGRLSTLPRGRCPLRARARHPPGRDERPRRAPPARLGADRPRRGGRHATPVPGLRAAVVGRVRLGQGGLRRVVMRLVQRPQPLLPGLGPAGPRSGHRLLPVCPHRRGVDRIPNRRRRRPASSRSDAATSIIATRPGRSPRNCSTPTASCRACWHACDRRAPLGGRAGGAGAARARAEGGPGPTGRASRSRSWRWWSTAVGGSACCSKTSPAPGRSRGSFGTRRARSTPTSRCSAPKPWTHRPVTGRYTIRHGCFWRSWRRPLWQVGDIHIWEEAARWLAGLHGRSLACRSPRLLRYDAAYFRCWLPRA